MNDTGPMHHIDCFPKSTWHFQYDDVFSVMQILQQWIITFRMLLMLFCSSNIISPPSGPISYVQRYLVNKYIYISHLSFTLVSERWVKSDFWLCFYVKCVTCYFWDFFKSYFSFCSSIFRSVFACTFFVKTAELWSQRGKKCMIENAANITWEGVTSSSFFPPPLSCSFFFSYFNVVGKRSWLAIPPPPGQLLNFNNQFYLLAPVIPKSLKTGLFFVFGDFCVSDSLVVIWNNLIFWAQVSCSSHTSACKMSNVFPATSFSLAFCSNIKPKFF